MGYLEATVVICCLCLVPSLLLVYFSIGTLNQTEWGLNLNGITLHVEKKTYGAGMHFLGFMHSFIPFPNTYQNMQFITEDGDLLHTRTSDGLPLTLGISFQYRLKEERLYDLYFAYKDNYEQVLFNVATHVLANSACNYTAYNFFNDKKSITEAMKGVLSQELDRTMFMNLEALQITLVELPDDFETAILESISVKQNITRTQRFKENQAVNFQTRIIAAHKSATQTITLAKGNAVKTLVTQNATATQIKQNVQAETQAYARVAKAMGWKTDEILQYAYYDSVTEQQSASNMVVGIEPGTFIRT